MRALMFAVMCTVMAPTWGQESVEEIRLDSILLQRLAGKVYEGDFGSSCKKTGRVAGTNLGLAIMKVDSIDVIWDPAKERDDLSRRIVETYSQANCTSTPREWRESLKFLKPVQEETELRMLSKLVTKFPIAAEMSVPPTGYLGPKLLLDLVGSKPVIMSKVLPVDERRIENVVQPQKHSFVRLQKVITPTETSFFAKIVVNARVTADYRFKGKKCSGSRRGDTGPLSRYLDIADRTIMLQGYVRDYKSSTLEVVYSEKDVTSQSCFIP